MHSPPHRDWAGWIFDLDGTLTVAQHDFDAMRAQLDLPADVPLLEGLEALPEPERERAHRAVEAWEWELAEHAQPAAGALELCRALRRRGARLGILTRNTSAIAWRTLEVIGLADDFERTCVIGRDDAAPKPAPEGVQRLLARWELEPEQAVVVGDFLFDLHAGQRAGTSTVWVDVAGTGRYAGVANTDVRSLAQLL